VYADELLLPWFAHAVAQVPGLEVYDCHNHVGERDPSGFTVTLEELETSLALVGAKSVVTPAADPAGYAEANRICTQAARRNADLTAFTRITPADTPEAMLEAGLADGASGIKLHGSSDSFELEDPRLEPVFRRADAENLPILVHAGPELKDVGAPAVRICQQYPGLRLILAHCALTDLGWLWERLDQAPNLFFDTAWWTPANLMALFRWVPPGRVLLGSDLPYASPLSGALTTLRCARQAGLEEHQVRQVMGGQLRRLIDRDVPLDLGPPPSAEALEPGPLLEILSSNLLAALEPMQRGDAPGVPLTVARRACDASRRLPNVDVAGSVLQLLDLYEENHRSLPQRNQFAPGWDLIAAAAVLARTPAAGAP
jgi:predicted TIM-barrel fold metal-dependent hydrolase